jgi:ribosome-associated protein
MEPETLARRIAELADSKGAAGILALDMRGLVSYTDFLVICTARNERQAAAIGEEVNLRLKRDERMLPRQVEGGPAAGWLILDYLDCVLHVFTPDARDRYRLEQLWADAARLDLGLAGESIQRRTARA